MESAGTKTLAYFEQAKPACWTEEARLSVAEQLKSAVCHLRANGVSHNDIKADNIMIQI